MIARSPCPRAVQALVALCALGVLSPAAAVPFTLEEATAAARSGASSVQRRRAELDKAVAALDEAHARFRPKVDLQASASYLTNPPEGITVARGQFGLAPSPNSPAPAPLPATDFVLVPDSESTYFKLTATLTQPVFTWGKLRAGVRVAESGRDIAASTLREAENEAVLNVRRAYFGAVLGRDSAAALREAEALLATAVADQEHSLEVGAATTENVLDARARLARVRTQRIQAEEAERSAQAGLSYLLDQEVANLVLTSTFRTDLPPLDTALIAEQAVANSTDLSTLDARLRQAAEAVAVQKASGPLRPDLALTLTLDITGQRIPFMDANWSDTWDAGLVITLGAKMPVYDFGQNAAKVRGAQADQHTAQIGRGELVRGLRLQAQQAVEAARNAHATVQEKGLALELAVERARAVHVAFENQLANRSDDQGAQVLVTTARLEVLLAQYQLELALANLDYLQGTPAR
jgi:outer membrane protein TolC